MWEDFKLFNKFLDEGLRNSKNEQNQTSMFFWNAFAAFKF